MFASGRVILASRPAWRLITGFCSLLVFGLIVAGPLCAAIDEIQPGKPVRIATLISQGTGTEIRSVETALHRLRDGAGITETFQAARGTYADVLYWLETGAVDLAVVSPAILALAMEQGGEIRWEYLASLERMGAMEPSASVALVHTDSAIRSIDDWRQSTKRGLGTFIFVDPFSVSGALAPRAAMAEERIAVLDSHVRYSHSHANSIRALISPRNRNSVAFVWNGSLDPAATRNLRTLDIPALSRLQIPPDALIVRADLPQIDLFKKAVSTRPADPVGAFFLADPTWRNGLGEVREWLRRSGMPPRQRLMRMDLDELGSLLAHYARSQERPLRLAVVFSGGGAKCSYQIGAIRAIEEKLTELRQETGDPSLEISLVVGTSGGAINALPVAMGMSRSPRLCDELDAVWRSLDQRDIIRPALAVRLNLALWFASLQVLIFSLLWRHGSPDRSTGERSVMLWFLCLMAGIIEIVLARIPIDPWNLLGHRPGLHRLYLWFSFGAEGSGWILLAIGLCGFALAAGEVRGRLPAMLSRRLLRRASLGLAIVLPVAQFWTIFYREPTLSEGYGIEQALASRLARLVAAKRLADESTVSPPAIPGVESFSGREALERLSREIMEGGHLCRDLVLTGSVLGQSGIDAPADLYFWASAGRTTSPPAFGARGVALAKRPELLLDSLIGSGAIYPVFPARRLHDFPGPGQSLEIVDGSFAHRSPIEAAVLWGATHILLVQADPDDPVSRGGFASNVSAALSHLYDQAQLTDTRTREQAMLFSLAPRPPHIGLLDFASNLIEASLAKGYREVSGNDDGTPPFLKQVGVPQFRALPGAGDVEGDARPSNRSIGRAH